MKDRLPPKRSAVLTAREQRPVAYARDIEPGAVHRVNARFDADTAAKLSEVTAGNGISVTEALRRAVGLLHAQFCAEHQRKARRPILESLIGKYSGAPTDLAENHKSYFAQVMGEKYGHHR